MKNKKDLSANLILLALFVFTSLNYAESLPQNQRYRRHAETTEISLSDEINTTDTDLLSFTESEYSEPILSDETVSNATDLNTQIDKKSNATNDQMESFLIKSENQEVDDIVATESDVPVDNELNEKVAFEEVTQVSNDLNQDMVDSINTSQPEENDITLESYDDSEDNEAKDDSEVEESKNDSEAEESKDDSEVEESKNDSEVEESKNDSEVEESKNDSEVEESKDDSEAEESKDDSEAEESKDDSEAEESKDDSEAEESKDDSEVEESKDDSEVEESKYDIEDSLKDTKDEEVNDDSVEEDESEKDNESDEGVFRTHTDMGDQLVVNPKFNHTIKQIPKEVRLVADCPDVSCDFGYQTDLNGKTLCTCYEPCADSKCGNKHCIIRQINDKFQGLCVDPEKTERPEKCHLSVQKGRCRNYDSRYYFNTFKNSCEHFVYRGCDGNKNNFKTWEECNTECNVCSQPPQTGKCRGHFIRYYFERSSGSCVAFSYSGCDGNRNNFNSLKQCQDTCL